MTVEFKDLVKDQTTTTGTGSFTVAGVAPTGLRTIAAAHTNGATLHYRASNDALTEWEVGEGVWNSGTSVLTRGTVFESSNAGALVSFSAGTKSLITTVLASDLQNMVGQSSSTGSAKLPIGTTAQRDGAPLAGWTRFNSDLGRSEVFNGTAWMPNGGGATGGGSDQVFVENDAVVTQPYTVGQNAYVAGVTMTITSPAVFTLAGHNFTDESYIHFTTTGALPTGLAVDTPYYVIPAGLTSGTFQLALTPDGTAINTSGTQSGIHSVGKIKNAISGGPIVVADGITVTIPNGSTWSIN